MNRYFIEIAYNGTNYHGWQIQQNARSIQAEINSALSTILQEEILVTGAGRTDTGVHAKQTFAHFELESEIDEKHTLYKVNQLLPSDIACKSVVKVKNDAHTRFSATSRTYEYWIIKKKNPFLTQFAYLFPHDLNIDLMNEAGQEILNYTDFSCFSKSKTDTHTNDCEVTEAYWQEKKDKLVFTISANRFLRNMVRAIVGTLLEIGQEKIELKDIKQIIASKNRSNAGNSVPAHGLYLTEVEYPSEMLNFK